MNKIEKHYGITQFNHGHEYRFIFSEKELKGILNTEELQFIEDNEWIDISFPIGGSNSSASFFKPLYNLQDVYNFLTEKAGGPDVEDPMLVDIAEYLLTIDVNEGCASYFLKELNLKADDLTQWDDEEKHDVNMRNMIGYLIATNTHEGLLDEKDPCYGFSKGMRYSELCELYEKAVNKAEETKC